MPVQRHWGDMNRILTSDFEPQTRLAKNTWYWYSHRPFVETNFTLDLKDALGFEYPEASITIPSGSGWSFDLDGTGTYAKSNLYAHFCTMNPAGLTSFTRGAGTSLPWLDWREPGTWGVNPQRFDMMFSPKLVIGTTATNYMVWGVRFWEDSTPSATSRWVQMDGRILATVTDSGGDTISRFNPYVLQVTQADGTTEGLTFTTAAGTEANRYYQYASPGLTARIRFVFNTGGDANRGTFTGTYSLAEGLEAIYQAADTDPGGGPYYIPRYLGAVSIFAYGSNYIDFDHVHIGYGVWAS